MFKKIILVVLCFCLVVYFNFLFDFKVIASEMIVGIDFEQDSSCNFYNTDLSLFTTDYKDTGRSAGLLVESGSQIEAYFDTSIGSQYADSQAIVFWLKTPEYADPLADLANLNIGLRCGSTRWKLNQSPSAGMAITYIWSSNNEVENVDLVYEGGGVFLDTPSDFEGFVIIPLNVLVKDWGPAESIDLPGAIAFSVVYEWMPEADQEKMYYFDNVGFTKYIEGIDFEESGDCNFYDTDYSTFSTEFMNTGRSAGLKAKNSSQIEAYFDTALSSQYADSQAIVMWLKTPEYADPSGDLANFNIGLRCGSTRWKLNQSPTSDMVITYIWSNDKLVQKIPLTYTSGVFLDAPSNFEGWVVIPLSTLVKDWGPAESIDLPGATAFGGVWEWIPTADLNKMYYFDTVGFTKDINGLIKSLNVTTDSTYILNEKVWRTPTIDRNGFVFEVQTMDGTPYSPYVPASVRSSIYNLKLGEAKKISSNVSAEEWANDFHFITDVFDSTPPSDREDAVDMLFSFLNSDYIDGAVHLWKSITGHFEYQHYAAEAGFDIIGTEIGEVINSYQMHIAFNRGAARQYSKPWFVHFSSWHGSNSMLDYSGEEIWGEASGDEKGHSMSLHERSYYMSYMSGASWLTAEAGGITFFYDSFDDDDNYDLTPLGEVGQKFNAFTKNNPNIGIPYTPFGILLDYYHGTYYGSDFPTKAFEYFDYNDGDDLTWTLLDKFFPDSWEAWNREELGTLTDSPYGDTCDILLQNASQEVINSYPVIILSGDIDFSEGEITRVINYVEQGGKLVINSAYLDDFPEFYEEEGGDRYDVEYGDGIAMVYGPDYDATELDDILSYLTTQLVPFSVSGNVEYIVNIKNGSMILTVINNRGITKPADGVPDIDEEETQIIYITYSGTGTVRWVKDLRTGQMLTTSANQTVTITPGELTILEFGN